MREKLELLIHFVVTLCKLSAPGGVKALIAENHVMKQQLVVMNRGNKRSPKLTTSDRFLFGLFAFFINLNRVMCFLLTHAAIGNLYKPPQ